MKVVSYLMDGGFHATRHAPGCGVLERAIREAEDQRQHPRYSMLRVYDEREWRLAPGTREPKDHACVAKAEAAV